MREIRTSGSEGGGVEPNRPSLPLSCVPRMILNWEVQVLFGPQGAGLLAKSLPLA